MRKETLLKLLGAVIAIAVYWMGYAYGTYCAPSEPEKAVMTDEEIMEEYVRDNFGNQYYGVLMDVDGDEYVDFTVYSDEHYGMFTMCSVHRETYR